MDISSLTSDNSAFDDYGTSEDALNCKHSSPKQDNSQMLFFPPNFQDPFPNESFATSHGNINHVSNRKISSALMDDVLLSEAANKECENSNSKLVIDEDMQTDDRDGSACNSFLDFNAEGKNLVHKPNLKYVPEAAISEEVYSIDAALLNSPGKVQIDENNSESSGQLVSEAYTQNQESLSSKEKPTNRLPSPQSFELEMRMDISVKDRKIEGQDLSSTPKVIIEDIPPQNVASKDGDTDGIAKKKKTTNKRCSRKGNYVLRRINNRNLLRYRIRKYRGGKSHVMRQRRLQPRMSYPEMHDSLELSLLSVHMYSSKPKQRIAYKSHSSRRNRGVLAKKKLSVKMKKYPNVDSTRSFYNLRKTNMCPVTCSIHGIRRSGK